MAHENENFKASCQMWSFDDEFEQLEHKGPSIVTFTAQTVFDIK